MLFKYLHGVTCEIVMCASGQEQPGLHTTVVSADHVVRTLQRNGQVLYGFGSASGSPTRPLLWMRQAGDSDGDEGLSTSASDSTSAGGSAAISFKAASAFSDCSDCSDGEAYQDELIGDAPSITNHATPSADCCEAKAHNARTGWGTQGAFREPLHIFHRGGLDRVWKTQISKCPPDAYVMMYDAAAACYSTQTATAIKHLKEFLAIDGLEEHTRRQRHNEGEAQQQLDHFDAEAERHQAIQEAMLRVVDVLLSLQRPNGTLAAEMLMMEADMRPWSQEGLSGVKGAIKASKFGSVQDIEQKLSDMLQDLEEYDCRLQEDDEDYEAQDKVFYLSRRHQTHDDVDSLRAALAYAVAVEQARASLDPIPLTVQVCRGTPRRTDVIVIKESHGIPEGTTGEFWCLDDDGYMNARVKLTGFLKDGSSVELRTRNTQLNNRDGATTVSVGCIALAVREEDRVTIPGAVVKTDALSKRRAQLDAQLKKLRAHHMQYNGGPRRGRLRWEQYGKYEQAHEQRLWLEQCVYVWAQCRATSEMAPLDIVAEADHAADYAARYEAIRKRKCERGHTLKRGRSLHTRRGRGTNECAECFDNLGIDTTVMGCRVCEYDLCDACRRRLVESGRPSVKTKHRVAHWDLQVHHLCPPQRRAWIQALFLSVPSVSPPLSPLVQHLWPSMAHWRWAPPSHSTASARRNSTACAGPSPAPS